MLINNDLHSIKLNVPRIFYVNQRHAKETQEGAMWRKTHLLLPRSQPVYHLYEYTVPEDVYQKHIDEITEDLANPDVEGVYETQVPLLFRTYLKLGCVCRVTRKAASILSAKETPDTFNLNQFESGTLAQFSYLEDSIRYIYFYQHNSGQKHFYGLFYPLSKKAFIYVTDTVRTNQMPNLNTMYSNERQLKLEKIEEDMLPSDGFSFEIRVEKDEKIVYRALQRHLSSYKDEKRGATYIAVQSKLTLAELKAHMPEFDKFPLVPVHINDSENLYSLLDWQRVGSRRMIQHFLNVQPILHGMLEQARYLHVPVGNLPKDVLLFGCDIFFARHLQKHGHVLWCSPTDKPDLGGKEVDQNLLFSTNDDSHVFEISNTNAYSSICVDLDMSSMAINTVVESARVHDFEGASAVSFDILPQTSIDDIISGGSSLSSYDETALVSAAFRVLKSMVHGWIRDVTAYKNILADSQIVHFYRWIRSSSGLLYEPALKRTLHSLMKKVLMQLVNELKKLGCQVVYASLNRLILCSKKNNLEDALSHIDYVSNSIRSKPLYHLLDFTYKQSWFYLMWMNSTNYSGVRAPVDEEEDIGVDVNFQIAYYLYDQSACRGNFNALTAGYMMTIHEKIRDDNLSGDELAEFCRKTIKDFSNKKSLYSELLLITQKLNKKFDQKVALDFVNTFCHVLQLDSNVTEVVEDVKSDLLRLISVDEFSSKAQFVANQISYILPEMLCPSCSHVRDVDLCQDDWTCIVCSTGYDIGQIELQLITALQNSSQAAALRDLICGKCNGVKADNMLTFCKCGGSFTVSDSNIGELLKAFDIIIAKKELNFLKDCVEWTRNYAS